jgi:RND family efflux transporter MFP subunit
VPNDGTAACARRAPASRHDASHAAGAAGSARTGHATLRGWPAALALAACLAAGCDGERASAPSAPPPTPELAAAVVEARDVDLTWSSEALVEAVRQSTVAAQVSGRIVDIRFDVGDRVEQGEVIVRIDERAATQALAASGAQVREAQAALADAKAQHERQRQLLAQGLVSRAVADQAEAAWKAAEARVTALLAGEDRAATERSFATIVAPYGGIVAARHVELGEMAVPGKPLMTGFDPATLRVAADVPQSQVAAIEASGRARIEIPSRGQWIEATRLTIVPAADPQTHTTRVRLDLPADVSGIYPGVFARVHFVVGRAPRLLVPRAALLRRSELTAVYVIGADGRPLLRQVRLGIAGDEQAVEVLSGLIAGERVALDPVRAGMSARGA